MSEDKAELAGHSQRDRIVIDYIRSQYFRVVHTDGAIGGPTPSGHIHLALFSERAAIPRRIVAPVLNGVVGEPFPEETIVREGMVREIDVDLIMSVSAAEEIGRLLLKMADDLKAAIKKARSGGAPNER